MFFLADMGLFAYIRAEAWAKAQNVTPTAKVEPKIF